MSALDGRMVDPRHFGTRGELHREHPRRRRRIG
jgi:hypothetical protein